MKFARILVPVTGTVADNEAIELACQLARQGKSQIHAIYIITPRRDLPLDAEIDSEIEKAEQVLEAIEDVGRKESCRIDGEVLQSRDIGSAIVNEAVEREADLVLMGSAYQLRYGQFDLGDVVPYVLKNSPCRVLLYQSAYSTEE
jgi:nucleotide-binding universal stress UspA family protein